jgi:predicted DCC family thiol-disulfide oxidoreductase YuxK
MSAPLPESVAAPPGRPTVLYDGECRVCRASADRIRVYDRAGKLDVVALQSPGVAERFPEIRREDLLDNMHFVATDGHVARGADAIEAIVRMFPRTRLLALAWLLPGFPATARRAYAWIARNRYRWNGS